MSKIILYEIVCKAQGKPMLAVYRRMKTLLSRDDESVCADGCQFYEVKVFIGTGFPQISNNRHQFVFVNDPDLGIAHQSVKTPEQVSGIKPILLAEMVQFLCEWRNPSDKQYIIAFLERVQKTHYQVFLT